MKNPSKIITAGVNSSIKDVIQKLQTNFVKHIVITDENKPVGVITEKDISRFFETFKDSSSIDEITANQVMKKDPVTLKNGKPNLSKAASRMVSLKIGSVIIVDSDGKLIDLITKSDVTKAYSVVFGGKFKVKDYMSNKVFTCRKSDSLEFALNMINQNEVSRLIVTNFEGNPISVITTNTFLKHRNFSTKTKDFSEKRFSAESEKICIGDLVKDVVLNVNPDDDLSLAAQKMIKNHVSGIPVVDDSGKLVGIVSNSDVVRALAKVSLNEELLEKYAESY